MKYLGDTDDNLELTCGVMLLIYAGYFSCQISLGSFDALCNIFNVNVSFVISTAVIKQIVKVHGPLIT